MDKKEIYTNIENAINALSIENISNVDLYIAGSSSISLRRSDFRSTMDIDLAKAVNSKARKILLKYEINDNMALATDPNISDDLEYVDQAVDLILESKGIKVYLVWEEYVAILKAFHASRKKDISDVKEITGKLDSGRIDDSLGLIIKSRERYGQMDPFKNELIEVAEKLKVGK